MELPTDTQIKLRIGYALSDRLATIAAGIIHNITSSTKLIQELPAAAIEEMLAFSREQHRQDNPRNAVGIAYKELRAAYIKYGEVLLREAQARENRLIYGIAGAPPSEEAGAVTGFPGATSD